MAYRIERGRILVGFKSNGFMGFSSFLNVCLFFTENFTSIELSKWYRDDLDDPVLFEKINNFLWDVLERLKHE